MASFACFSTKYPEEVYCIHWFFAQFDLTACYLFRKMSRKCTGVEQELKLSHTCPRIRDRMDEGGLAAVEDSIEEGALALFSLFYQKTTHA
jgi:hypothetical protein